MTTIGHCACKCGCFLEVDDDGFEVCVECENGNHFDGIDEDGFEDGDRC